MNIETHRLSSWASIIDAIDSLRPHSSGWVFRGHECADWNLKTGLEREFNTQRHEVERETYWRFVRLAPPLLPRHVLVPDDNDAAAWLGLIQHYGGPTRLLDVTRSPYVALYFAFEAPDEQDRALWAIDGTWCMAACARIMARNEGMTPQKGFERASAAQAQMVYFLVHRQQPFRDVEFKPFTGVFLLDPWKPDSRQSAQQAQFLCTANIELSFMDNLAAHEAGDFKVLYRFVLPASLRQEAIERLSMMNVTAATLFPDLGGLGRSLRTLTVRRPWQ